MFLKVEVIDRLVVAPAPIEDDDILSDRVDVLDHRRRAYWEPSYFGVRPEVAVGVLLKNRSNHEIVRVTMSRTFAGDWARLWLSPP